MIKTVFAVITLLLGFSTISNAETITGAAQVIDGDTITIDGQEIELLFINAPELDQTCFDLEQDKRGYPKPVKGSKFFGGQLAAAKLTGLISNQTVSCEIHRWKKSKKDHAYFGDGKIMGIDQKILAQGVFGVCKTASVNSLSIAMAKLGLIWTYGKTRESLLFYRKDRKLNPVLKDHFDKVYISMSKAKENAMGIYSNLFAFPRCLVPSTEQKKGKLQ